MNKVKALSLAAIVTGTTAVMLNSAEIVNAAIWSHNASDFCKTNGYYYPDCVKVDFDGSQNGTISCPQGDVIDEVFVHAGDGQTVYQLPHDGFLYSFSNTQNTVTVSLNGHPHGISWIGATCDGSTQPTPTPTVTPTPTPTPTPTIPPCDDNECEEPTPTVTPTPTTEPSPTPTPEEIISRLFTVDATCDSDEINATMHVSKDNKDVSGVRVVFRYNNLEKIALTGNDGNAGAKFTYTGDAWLDAQPDGIENKAHFITKETDCSVTDGKVLGASTEGQVLGAYADTGVAEDVMMTLAGLMGVTMFTSGAVLHVKNKA